MTNYPMPRTPFSTPLSGSARETEIRLKNIFSGPKKRPPMLFLALMFSVCLLCGNLVSCQTRPAEEPDVTQAARLDNPEPTEDTTYWTKASQALLEQMEFYDPTMDGWSTLLTKRGESLNLLLMSYTASGHTGGFYNLLLGTFDQEGRPVDYYELPGDAGLYSAWEEGGALHLLCTNTNTWQGWESGGAPMYFLFDGTQLTLADTDWEAEDYKYLPVCGTLEVYRRTEGWSNISEEWWGKPQWEYVETRQVAAPALEPDIPELVYRAARTYIDQTEYAGTPIARLEQMVEWTDFTGISLCPEWQDREDLTLVSYDVDYNDPGEISSVTHASHLLFLKEGDRLTFLTAFYDGALSAPEPEYLAGLSPYNWYASAALADAGYLTARPRMANTITQTPVPQAAWRLAADWCENHPETGLTAERLEPVAVVTTQPGWVAVYRMNGEYLAFFEISDFRAFHSCLTVRPEHGVSSLEKAALSAYWGLLDSEVALWDLSQMPYYASAVGPGANRDFFLTVQDESLADDSGSWTGTGRLFEVRFRTVPGNEGGWGWRYTAYLDTTRRLPTARGTVIGDSLDKVRADYPELRSDPVTGAWVYQGEQGAVMEFYFEKNVLSRIILKEGNE